MHASSQTARSRPARHSHRPRRLFRRFRGGRAALVAQIDDLYDAPLTDGQLVVAIAHVIYDPAGELRYDRAGALRP